MVKNILAVIAAILVIAIAVLAYSFLRRPEEASGPIQAIPVSVAVQASRPAEGGDASSQGTDVPLEPTEPARQVEPQATTSLETGSAAGPEAQAGTDTPADADAPVATTPESEAEASPETETASVETMASPIIFEIVPAESEARFLIDEVLRGDPTTVVGATNQVAGQLALDANHLSSIQLGIIQVNARTLATDNEFRNRAIKNQILQTNNYEFVTFTPTKVVGLTDRGTVGETFIFQIEGDLTITDVTQRVTFDVTAMATSNTRLEGKASTTILYTDFELFIPDSPSVDTVADEVRLELDFVAEAA